MKTRIPFPLIINLLIFNLMVGTLLLTGLQSADGHLGYPLDDVYIHMAIAKNFVVEGVWGITPYGFTSTTSSPLWTLLIALVYKIFGVNEWAPLALGILMGNAALIVCFSVLKRKFTSLRLTLLLLLFIFFTALPFWAAMGMEHLLHSVLTLGLMYYAVELIFIERIRPGQYVGLFLLSAFLTFTRYEGLFLAGVLFLVFLIKKRTGAAFAVLAGGLFFISIYGIISVRNGWYFFPNTILLKGNRPIFSGDGMIEFLTSSIDYLFASPQFYSIIIMILLSYIFGSSRSALSQKQKTIFWIFMLVAAIQMQLTSQSTFTRYEFYLLMIGIILLFDLLSHALPAVSVQRKLQINDLQAVGLLLCVLIVLNIAIYSGRLFRVYPLAVQNIHDQQYQMGRFLKEYYAEKTVAVNDIGLVSFLSESRVLDLWGLGNVEIARNVLDDAFYQSDLIAITQEYDTQLVIIFDSWFRDVIPSEWVKVGEWELTDNIVCGDSKVSFYTVSAAAQEELAANLRDFSASLPARVIQRGLYTQ